jgi:molecular chaperone GrpE
VSSAHASAGDNGPVDAAQAEGFSDLKATLDRLIAATEREHERAAHREAVIDRLHDDNQMLRRGEIQTIFEPVRSALYRLHDMVRREAERCSIESTGSSESTGSLLCTIADEIAEALARTGAERFVVPRGEPFDPVRHRPVGTAPVTDAALDGAVVEARTDGFAQGEQILRKAGVVIGRVTGADTVRQNASAKSI